MLFAQEKINFVVDIDNLRSALMLSDEMKAWVAISAFQSNDKGELIVKFEDTSSSFREMISFITKVKKDQLTFSEPKQDYSQVRFADIDSFIKDVDVKDCLKWRSHNIGCQPISK